jgi:hypothetical protein
MSNNFAFNDHVAKTSDIFQNINAITANIIKVPYAFCLLSKSENILDIFLPQVN